MKYVHLLLTIILSINIKSQVELLDRIAVIVDDGLIMESQVKEGLDEMLEKFKDRNISIDDMAVLKEQVVESLIIEELQLQLADRAGVRISDSELNDTIIRIAANNNYTLEEFIDTINSGDGSYEELRETIRKQLIIQRVQRGKVANEINITDVEFETYLRNDDSLAELEPELLIQQITVKTLSEAQTLIERIKKGDDFSDLATSFSKDSYAKNGGLTSWRRADKMPKLFSDSINQKPIGFITPAIKSGAGYHILKLIEKRGDYVKYEDQWLSRHILLIPSTLRNAEQTKIELNKIRERVINGEKFSDLANEFSEDPGSAKMGGELGWLGLGVLAPEFEKTMINAEIGNISKIFETQFGFHFLEVLETRNYDKTRDLIEEEAYQRLYARKYEEELENTLRAMRADAFVEIKDLD